MLAMIFVLLAAIGLSSAGRAWPLVACAALLAAWAGTTFPDLDLPLGLGHRSGLTHSIFPVAIAFAQRLRAAAAGLAMGLGLHLSADLFPNGMTGFATVKLPFAGSIGASASYGWFAANAAIAFLIGGWLLGRLLPPLQALMVIAATALIGIAYLFVTDGGWWALAMFGGFGWVAVRRPRPV